MQLVDRFNPTITVADALRAASPALRDHLLGRLPDWDELVIAVAWGSHETARWKKAANYNPGGVTCGSRYPGPCFASMTHEYLEQPDGSKKKVPLRRLFRSYPSLEAGMADWFDILKRGYPQAVEGLRDGDVKAFVMGLLEGWKKSLDYFTAPPELYLKAVAAHVPEVERELAKLDGEAPRGSARLFEPTSFGQALLERVLDAAEAA